ncbi:AAA domain protein [Lysinibacillus phage vB_LfM_LysYB1]|nr:AAA domain protein [Lysinibacillus phage vB_LfM_LysYB1]WAB25325.1 AAA domain protein [Lysinibacillus phage vB_LfM_LysYB2]
MKHGLILGKFMPLHTGHEYLVKTGLENCDMLTILVCSLPTEPIPGEERYRWMWKSVRSMIMTMKKPPKSVRVIHYDKVVPQEPSEDTNFWTIWHDLIKKNHPEPIDVVFSSEMYGYELAELFGAEHHMVDLERERVPISGTQCRQDPHGEWDFISEAARPYFIKKVRIIGGESCGKSELTKRLAEEFNTEYVNEYGRTYIEEAYNNNMNEFRYEDLVQIAEGHRYYIDVMASYFNTDKLLFIDTDHLTTKIFSELLYGKVDEFVERLAREEQYDLTLLCHPDVPWVQDGSRTFENNRYDVFEKFKTELTARGVKWVDVKGTWDERWEIAKAASAELLKKAVEQNYDYQ